MRSYIDNRTFRFGLTVAALCAVALCGAQVSAAVYYVRAGGNDSNDGSTPVTAFQTMDKASTVVASGDTVYVGAGTYLDTVVLDGIQQSTAPMAFIADIDGGFTGDAGPVIISNAMLAVVNSNYVEFHKFAFQNTTERALVWKGSYDGLLKDCTFTGGDEPLLIKDGSVTIEDCQLADFVTDAIYVDGEAVVELVASSISGCQGDGIEIAKTARVILRDTSAIQDSVGDGIKVERTETYIDDGGVGASGGIIERLVAGKFRIIASLGMIDGYDSTVGPYGAGNSLQDVDLYGNSLVSAGASVPVYGNVYYGPTGSASVPNLSGTTSQMSSNITMDPIDVGDAATNNDNGSIPLTSLGRNPYVGGNLLLSGGETLDLPPGTYYFTQVAITTGAMLNITGPTTIFVTYRVTLSGGSIANPTQKPGDLKFLVTGSLVTLSGSAALHAAIYAPDAQVALSGSTAIYGMVVANEIIANSTGGIHLDKSLATYAAEVQGLPMGSSSPAPPPSWTAITAGEVDLTSSTLQRNRRAVNVVTAQSFTAVGGQFLDNDEWGLCLNGHCDLDDCTISGNGIGGLRLEAVNDVDCELTTLTIADNPTYGMYLQDCNVTFDAISLDEHTFTTGSNYLLYAQGGSLTLDGVTIANGSVAAVYASASTLEVKNGSHLTDSGYGVWADQSTVTITGGELSNNDVGLYAVQNPTLTVTGTDLINNTSWGAKVDLTSTTGITATFSGATVSGNANGILFVGGASAAAELPNTVIDNNTNDGLRIENADLTVDATASPGLQITNSLFGINSVNSTLTLTGLTISGHSTAAVYAVGGDLTVHGATLSGSGYGVWGNGCDSVTLDNSCTLSGNGTGLYADQIADLQVNSSTFTANTTWGANVIPKTAAGLCVIFDDCTFDNNFAGLTLLNAVDGQVLLRSNTMFRDNTNSGLHFASCNLTVNDQAGGSAWRTLRNGYGISTVGSTLTLSGASVEESGFYGVHCKDSTVSLTNCTVTAVGGIYADSDNDGLTVASTTLKASGSGGWGVARYGGDVDIKNCILDGFAGGVYLSTAFSGDVAEVKNCTLVNLANDGVQLEDGDATVQNTILAGAGASYGLVQVSGTLTHSHNLLDGFATPYSGTTAGADELLTDPRFEDAAGGDFRLKKGSPAINSGTDLSISHTVDIQGNVRPSRKVFEIGAYEYIQDGGSLRVLKWKEDR